MKLTLTLLAALLLAPLAALHAADSPSRPIGPPALYWSAEPVMPGEAAMLQGSGLDAVTRIELSSADKSAVVPVLDANERSLRFVLPKEWSAGVVKCRVVTTKGVLEHTLNAPQPWWRQADEGQAATPGGWVRVCGRCLLIDGEAKVKLRRAGRTWPLKVREATMWSLDAELPAATEAGVFANNVQITDCDLAWTKNIGFAAQGDDIVCRGNRAQADEGGWCPVGGGRRAVVEHNDFNGVTTGITRGAEVFFAHNKIAHMDHGFREGFTTDGAFGGPCLLKDAKVAGREITHAGASPSKMSPRRSNL